MESKYAKIENGIVTNIEVVTDEFFNANPERYSGMWIKVGEGTTHLLYGIGWTCTGDAFIPPQPFPSWIYDEVNTRWNPPVEKPFGSYIWNEELRQWVAM